MKNPSIKNPFKEWIKLLRWNKPSGRLILLIPAGWSLWLAPSAPPEKDLVFLIFAGGILVSGAGCIANDLWDRRIDRKVARTMSRPLAKGTVEIKTAWGLLLAMLVLSLVVISQLAPSSREICFGLALLALPPILIYPSAKRWFAYPQAILAICWGFSVLIPWAASESNLNGGITLLSLWLATMFWTFGFDTVYAMADRNEDKKLGIRSSVLSLKEKSFLAVSVSYITACLFLAISAISAKVGWIFWPIWTISFILMQYETRSIVNPKLNDSKYGKHFQHQVGIGFLLLIGIILGRFG